jgi:hypothetical protein
MPRLGDVHIKISDSLFENIELTDKLRLFTTKDIKQRNILLTFENTKLIGNRLDKGFQFEFKHNFR